MTEQQIPLQQKLKIDDEIDLLALVKIMWNGRKIVFRLAIIGAIIGTITALFSPNEYTVTTLMVPQLGGESQSKMGGLGGLATLAGINLGMSQGNELMPMVYPQIVNSIPFQLELMNTPLNFQNFPKPITLLEYYTKYNRRSVFGTIKKYTIGLPGMLIGAVKRKSKELELPVDSVLQPIQLSPDQFIVSNLLANIVSLDLNSKEGYISLTCRLPEAFAAAQLAQKAQKLMQRYITEFRIERVKADLDFIQGRYNEIKTEFEKAQVSLALVNDRGKNFTSGIPQIEADRIQTKYTIAFSVFQDLAKQLEQAKIQVKKETPVFAIVQPVIVPLIKSKPNRSIIIFTWLFLCGFIGICIVFGKAFLSPTKNGMAI